MGPWSLENEFNEPQAPKKHPVFISDIHAHTCMRVRTHTHNVDKI